MRSRMRWDWPCPSWEPRSCWIERSHEIKILAIGFQAVAAPNIVVRQRMPVGLEVFVKDIFVKYQRSTVCNRRPRRHSHWPSLLKQQRTFRHCPVARVGETPPWYSFFTPAHKGAIRTPSESLAVTHPTELKGCAFFLDPTVSNVTFVPAITNWLFQETTRCRSQTWNNRQKCNGSTNRCNDHSAPCS